MRSKVPNGWYIENSLTTINQKDPLGEYNSTLWNNGTEAGKEQTVSKSVNFPILATSML